MGFELDEALHDVAKWVRGALGMTQDGGEPATPGKATATATATPAAVTPAPALAMQAQARLAPFVGQVITDNAGITYTVTADNAFVISKVPAKWEGKGKEGRVITADGEWAASWQNLARLVEARAARQPKPEAAPTQTPAPAAAPAPKPAKALTAGVDPDVTAALASTEPRGGTAMDTNLIAAENAADALTVSHSYDRKKELMPAPLAKGASKEEQDEYNALVAEKKAELAAEDKPNADAIRTGNLEGMTSIVCSGFTALALRRAGIDLDQPFHDKTTGLKVAVKDGSIKWVTLYGVLQNFPAQTIAVIRANRRELPRIEPGSPEATALGGFKSTEAFLYCSDDLVETPIERQQAYDAAHPLDEKLTEKEQKKARKDDKNRPDGASWAVELQDGDAFGAGAAAQSLGGVEVAQAERRPGDIQQRLDAASGKAKLSGHSSTVWMVRGSGIAYLGGEGSPKLFDAPAAKPAPGWYRVEGGAMIELDPHTDPALVARCDVASVQLIEANTNGVGADATGIGKIRPADAADDPKAADSDLTSTGRLPSSKWLGWTPSAPDVVGVVTKAGIHAA